MGREKRMATHKCGSKMCWGIAMGICLLIGVVFIITGPVLWANCAKAKSDCDDACSGIVTCPTGCHTDTGSGCSRTDCISKLCDLAEACSCGKVRGGIAMIILGIIFFILGLVFVCGFVPCCCFAGPDVPGGPAVAGAAPVEGVVVQGKM